MFRGGGECPAQIFGTFPECLVDGGELRSPPELNNVVGERHQLPLEGRGQGSLLLPWEGEQVAVVEPKPQKVVLIRCEVVVVQEVEITPVGDGPGWEHHDDWEHNRSRQWQKLNWCWLMLMLMLYRPHYQRICFFAFLYFWNSLFAFLERLPTKGSNWTPLIQKTWNYHGNQTKTMKTMILPFKKHGN